MTPVLPQDNPGDVRLIYPELPGEFCLANASGGIPIRHGTEMQLPGEPVGSHVLAICQQPAVTPMADILIEPAGACLADIVPEALFCWPAFASPHAVDIDQIGQALQHKLVTA